MLLGSSMFLWEPHPSPSVPPSPRGVPSGASSTTSVVPLPRGEGRGMFRADRGGVWLLLGASLSLWEPHPSPSVPPSPRGRSWGCTGRIEVGFVGVVWFFYVPLGASSVTFGATFPEGKVMGMYRADRGGICGCGLVLICPFGSLIRHLRCHLPRGEGRGMFRVGFKKKFYEIFWGCGGLFRKKAPVEKGCGERSLASLFYGVELRFFNYFDFDI